MIKKTQQQPIPPQKTPERKHHVKFRVLSLNSLFEKQVLSQDYAYYN